MEYKKYNFDDDNFPKYESLEDKRIRNHFIMDSYWHARNLREIIAETYGTDKIRGLYNNKHEIYFSLMALCCELYLKSLVFATCEENIKRDHDLVSLFNKLPESFRKAIIELINEDEFDRKLDNTKNAFINFRYSYEMKGYKLDATFLLHLMNALSDLCDRVYPKHITDGYGKMYQCGWAMNGVFYTKEVQ